MSHPPIGSIGSLEDLYPVLASRNYAPLWRMTGALTPRPATRMRPMLWRYAEVRQLILQAGELISAEEAERRVLAFRNPGTAAGELDRATDNLWAAVQLVLPGEVAPPHRHTAAALRYVIEGSGAYTVVDGRRYDMEAGDVVLTPNWAWHEHGHAGDGPMIWLDGLDLPMVHTMRQVFAEHDGAPSTPLPLPPDALRTGELRPAWHAAATAPTIVYKLADVEALLDHLAGEAGSPYDDLIVEYRDPAAGGPVLPTIGAYMQRLRAGRTTRSHRHTASAVYHVVRGTGRSTVAGETLEWGPGDTFVVPTWAEHHHANPGSEDATLFSFTDGPSLAALGLDRSEPDEIA